MRKLRFLLCLLAVAIFCGARVNASAKKVMVLFDRGDDKTQPALSEAKCIANLLGHFDTHVEFCPVSNYQRGMIDLFDIVFYINYEAEYDLPAAFKADVLNTNKTFCWINLQLRGLDQQKMERKFGFHFNRYIENSTFNKVVYQGVAFPKAAGGINIVDIDDPSIAKVKAYSVDNKGNRTPYIVNSHNFWYVADSPFAYVSEKDRYIVFADVLHDITGEYHKKHHTGLVRLEDVNPESDPKSLLETAQYLYSQKIPFAVALVPVYINPTLKQEIHLNEKPELLAALRAIPGLGGSIVLHGYTHQYKGVSAEDYEFWDIASEKPVEGDSVENDSIRIDKGIKECLLNGIYPLVWETPHYIASGNAFCAIKKYFSVSYERRNTMDNSDSDQFFPYPVKDVYGERIIPENLGYVHGEKPDTKYILDAAKLNLAVRDGYASFFFHPFVKLEYLKQIVKGLKSMGYKFGDIRDFSPVVEDNDAVVLTPGNHHIRIETRDKYICIKEMDYNGEVRSTSILPMTKAPFEENIACPKSRCIVIMGQNSNTNNRDQITSRN